MLLIDDSHERHWKELHCDGSMSYIYEDLVLPHPIIYGYKSIYFSLYSGKINKNSDIKTLKISPYDNNLVFYVKGEKITKNVSFGAGKLSRRKTQKFLDIKIIDSCELFDNKLFVMGYDDTDEHITHVYNEKTLEYKDSIHNIDCYNNFSFFIFI